MNRPSAEGTAGSIAGFYGKLPCTGDFIKRRLSPEFVAAWDSWLQRVIQATRETLNDRWREVYLTSPVWRFALSTGAGGPAAWAGVLVPSVDKVGRYFPISVLRPLAPGETPLALITGSQAWFEAVESLALKALKGEIGTVDAFDQQVQRLALAPAPAGVDLAQAGQAGYLFRPVASFERIGADLAAAAHERIEEVLTPSTFWWTAGSDRVPIAWVTSRGLPPPEVFLKMLGGEDLPVEDDDEPSTHPTTASRETILQSAGVTHAGNARGANQDAFVRRDENGLWVVADGMGGGRDGDRASRLVCQRLERLPARLDLSERLAWARQALIQANAELTDDGERAKGPCASTVVALMADGGRYAALWAGDSRLYRLRDGKLEQLTRDHSVAEQALANGNAHAYPDLVSSNVITRAIGADEELEFDEVQGELAAGDRFLLCSDGIYREVEPGELRDLLAGKQSPDAICRTLKELVLSREAKDNLTAVVVQVG